MSDTAPEHAPGLVPNPQTWLWSMLDDLLESQIVADLKAVHDDLTRHYLEMARAAWAAAGDGIPIVPEHEATALLATLLAVADSKARDYQQGLRDGAALQTPISTLAA